jgi:hypothetical protein
MGGFLTSQDSAAGQPGARYGLRDQLDIQRQALLSAPHLLPPGSLPPGVATPRVVVAGHSIGAWMCSQLLFGGCAVEGALLLFPTVCHMALTRNGLRMHRPLRFLEPTVTALGHLLAVLPVFLKALLGIVAIGRSAWRHFHLRHAVLHGVMGGDTAGNAVHMAAQELYQVTDPPLEDFVQHQRRLAFLYARGVQPRCELLSVANFPPPPHTHTHPFAHIGL